MAPPSRARPPPASQASSSTSRAAYGVRGNVGSSSSGIGQASGSGMCLITYRGHSCPRASKVPVQVDLNPLVASQDARSRRRKTMKRCVQRRRRSAGSSTPTRGLLSPTHKSPCLVLPIVPPVQAYPRGHFHPPRLFDQTSHRLVEGELLSILLQMISQGSQRMLLKQLSVAFINERIPTHCRLPPRLVDLRISLDPRTKNRNRHHKHEVLAVSGNFIAKSKRPHILTLQSGSGRRTSTSSNHVPSSASASTSRLTPRDSQRPRQSVENAINVDDDDPPPRMLPISDRSTS